MLSVIVPSRTDEYLDRLLNSLLRHGNGKEHIIVVDSGLSFDKITEWEIRGVKFVNARLPFVFGQALNDGVVQARPGDDLLLMNDDTEVQTPGVSDILLSLLADPSLSDIGLFGLKVQGGCGNDFQRNISTGERCLRTNRTVCFVAVAVRRTVWNAVGGMCEDFTGYGYDDDFFCRETVKAGYTLGLTGLVTVTHGFPPYQHSASYLRYHIENGEWNEMGERNRKLFNEKYPQAQWNPVTGANHES